VKHFTPDEYQQLLAGLQDGETQVSIARTLGRSRSTVRRHKYILERWLKTRFRYAA